METNDCEGDKTEESTPHSRGREKATGFDEILAMLADRIHKIAEALGEKAAERDAQSSVALHTKQASEWLDQSADYVRQIDYEEADAKVREYVKQHPERCLLIAGAVGLIIGVVWRRR